MANMVIRCYVSFIAIESCRREKLLALLSGYLKYSSGIEYTQNDVKDFRHDPLPHSDLGPKKPTQFFTEHRLKMWLWLTKTLESSSRFFFLPTEFSVSIIWSY